ncbi:MAG TPA: NosD domain-containing protein [Desulfosporosinus sp.]|nr:NosD domain-containing protein [Desulfosporosinus sp.]
MKLKIIIVLLIAALAHFSNPLIAMADEFYVETGGSDENDGSEASPWGTIQGAIDNSAVENGDTINVGSGTFTENIAVNKSVKIYGEETGKPVITAEDSSDNVFRISANSVEIKNLVIKGAGGSEAAGVYVNSNIDDCSVSYCELSDNEYGIYLDNTDDAVVYENEFKDNHRGAYLYKADKSKITYNEFKDNTVGIYLVKSEIGY